MSTCWIWASVGGWLNHSFPAQFRLHLLHKPFSPIHMSADRKEIESVFSNTTIFNSPSIADILLHILSSYS